MQRTRITFLRVASCLATVMLFLAFALLVGVQSFKNAAESREVLAALTDARSVTIVEFAAIPEEVEVGSPREREVILRTINASLKQVSEFRRVISRYLALSDVSAMIRCFRPHHRVDVVRSDGVSYRLDICFQCSNMTKNGGGITVIPVPWRSALADFFTKLDMTPKSEAEYRKLAGNEDE